MYSNTSRLSFSLSSKGLEPEKVHKVAKSMMAEHDQGALSELPDSVQNHMYYIFEVSK